MNKLAQKYRHENEDSDSEDDIPLMELAKRIKARDLPEIESQNTCFWFDFCFTAIRHILGHFGRGQLT